MIYEGDFGSCSISSTSRGLETKVSHMGSQSWLQDRTLVKGLDIEAPASYSGWQYPVSAGKVSLVSDTSRRGSSEAPCARYFSSLLLDDFNLHLYTKIICNSEHKSFQWVLLAKVEIECSLGNLKVVFCVRSGCLQDPWICNWFQKWGWYCRLFANFANIKSTLVLIFIIL